MKSNWVSYPVSEPYNPDTECPCVVCSVWMEEVGENHGG